MSTIRNTGIVFAVLTLSVAVTAAPLAAAQTVMSDAHIEKIKANCLVAQNTLSRLHAADALLRVNRGQVYESISVKLMASMNSRIALNRLDGRDMVAVAASYEQELVDFRASYREYEQNMTQLLKTDCTKQPVTFYDQVAVVRQNRTAVHEHVIKLHQYITDYKSAFDIFSVKFTTQEDK